MRTSRVFAHRLFLAVVTSLVTSITSLTSVEKILDLLEGYRIVIVLNFLIFTICRTVTNNEQNQIVENKMPYRTHRKTFSMTPLILEEPQVNLVEDHVTHHSIFPILQCFSLHYTKKPLKHTRAQISRPENRIWRSDLL